MDRFRAGFARVDITCYEPHLAMFGWGREDYAAQGVARALHARTLVVERGDHRIAYVCCDLGYITESLRLAVMAELERRELGFADADLMISATHTHSGPSGYSTYLFYALAGPGFSQKVHDALALGIVESITSALASLAPARLYAHEGDIPLTEPVAFNRSMPAYLRNPDAPRGTTASAAAAADRRMTVLRVDHEDGRPMGLVSWFPVHATSVHPGNEHGALIHSDNKGEAALRSEADFAEKGAPDFVAIFAQGPAGDVSPNDRLCPRRKVLVGRGKDDHESARIVGHIQARFAEKLHREAITEGSELSGPIVTALRYVDFFEAPVDPVFVNGRRDVRTGPPCMGLGAGAGTAEGPGPFHDARGVLPLAARVQRLVDGVHARVRGPSKGARTHAPMVRFWELGFGRHGRLFGVLPAAFRPLTLSKASYVQYAQRALRTSGASELPSIPRYLPAHLMQIGRLAIAGLPLEPTVTSGRRLAAVLRERLPRRPSHVVVNGYANAYVSYLTTPEEYEVQLYEGASTFYGRWSLPAWCTAFASLAESLESREGPRPMRRAAADCLPL